MAPQFIAARVLETKRCYRARIIAFWLQNAIIRSRGRLPGQHLVEHLERAALHSTFHQGAAGTELVFDEQEWTAFRLGAKDGEFTG